MAGSFVTAGVGRSAVVSKELTTEELIARIASDVAELQRRLGGAVAAMSGEGDEPTDRP
jgi:hypothetical protein